MKKFLLVLAAVCCVATVSAKKSVVETVKSTVTESKWAVGLRVGGTGLHAQAEMFINKTNYIEARFGLGYANGATADFIALYNWNCMNWNWTPKFATWFLDAGCGFNLGGGAKTIADVYVEDEYLGWVNGTNIYAGVAGQVKFGMKFKKVPIRLSVDYTPVLGFYTDYPTVKGKKEIREANDALQAAGSSSKVKAKHNGAFYGAGLYNFAVSATWCF